jgi:hypothetical protein
MDLHHLLLAGLPAHLALTPILRNLTERARARQFSLGPVLMALLRAATAQERKHA